ncbi:MAG: RNA ligase [Candidatus Berkelbacteria bacterium Licking1014_7]|uniref:RNA ligase n=1 Tax=Candidatus Berkelbacteria bacterium Licking1014_7 TaxID=2017147 RepID=A0A554LHY4_9BACT|nr:MAG: RNA ligase [Candidatus Berkelbacteria bacterium Licking1014_7]
MSEQLHQLHQEKIDISRVEKFLESANAVLEGEMSGIIVRESGSLRLFNAERMLIYEGYDPNQEYLKGLICQIENGELKIVAPCFSKFYNLGEKSENDQKFYQLLQQEGVVVHFPEKVDGTNIRFYINPDTQEIGTATRGMIDGGKDKDEEGFGDAANIHFGREALAIAKEQFPQILDKELLGRFTPIFELIHPENRIVTNYGDRKDLVLLAVFDKMRGCRELTRKELDYFAKQHGLNLVETLQVDSSNWNEALRQLHTMWQGTDKEGAVVTVELNNEVSFRVKVKSPEYLELMRVMKFCTLNRTEELADNWGTATWETFREKLHEQHPDLPEEVMMGYEIHFQIYKRYLNFVHHRTEEIIEGYDQFVQENAEKIVAQKDFALMIQNRADKSFFFLLRKLGREKIDEAKQRMIEQLRKQTPLKDFISTPF